MTRRELLLASFDDHIITLRILARRYLGADRIEDLTSVLNPDWRSVRNWYNSLWLFELQGIKVSGYPDILENAATTEYATPRNFARRAASVMFLAPDRNRTIWHMRWNALPTSEVELDPRFVAFRTILDWIVLSAKVLAEKGDAFDDQETGVMGWEPRERVDPFNCELPQEAGPDEVPIEMSCGSPREQLVGGRSSNHWDPNFLEPEWRNVKRPWAAIRYQHHCGLLLPMELRYGALREQSDPRLAQLELLQPEIFRAYIAGVLASGDDVGRSQAWRARSAEDVRCDPRFVAHQCGFDSQMILHIAREAMKGSEPESTEPNLEFILDGPEIVPPLDEELLHPDMEPGGPPDDDKPGKPK